MVKRYHYITPEDYEIAEKNGIKQATLDSRVYQYGWDVERAITEKPRVNKAFRVTWTKWGSVALEHGVGRNMFYHRLRNGMSEEQAATMAVSGNRWTSEELQIMKQNGLNPNAVAARIDKLGWSKEDALNTPKITGAEHAKRVADGTRKYHKERGVNRGFKKTI